MTNPEKILILNNFIGLQTRVEDLEKCVRELQRLCTNLAIELAELKIEREEEKPQISEFDRLGLCNWPFGSCLAQE